MKCGICKEESSHLETFNDVCIRCWQSLLLASNRETKELDKENKELKEELSDLKARMETIRIYYPHITI